MKTVIVQFPGSNCDQDCFHVFNDVLGTETRFVWHTETDLGEADLVLLPGGFSYGDYLRAGAIARVSPIMESVRSFAMKGGYVLGICNGFQILLENHMLPGAMLRNSSLEFVCKDVYLRVGESKSPFLNKLEAGDRLLVPIAHAEGNYFIDEDGLKSLIDHGQIAFQYCDEEGHASAEVNPNGSLLNIAGITNKEGNVLGMMPHPERASEELLGSTAGWTFLRRIVSHLTK